MQSHSKRADIARGIADAAARWCDADFPPRVRAQARIAQRTRYSLPVVEYALDQLFGAMTYDAILTTIEREVGAKPVAPVGRVAIISSRTTIGVAIIPAIFAICADCEVVVKDREDELVASFFETLAEELGGPSSGPSTPALRAYARDDKRVCARDDKRVCARDDKRVDARDDNSGAFAAQIWDGGARDLSAFDCVVAFGGDDALAAIRSQLKPDARFIAYGPKASIGYVTREALRDERAAARIAAGAAHDLVLYDGEGCLSLHTLFVEKGAVVPVARFTALLAGAVERANVEFPLGERDAGAIARVAALRDLAQFRGAVFNSDAQARFLIEPGSPDRPPAFAPRALAVHDVDEPEEMRAYAERHALPLEACAVAGERRDVAAAAIAAGANRISAFGEMQHPSLTYAHGGRPRFAEFVRFISEDE